jgi:O-antigen/teichoic acid export membrane protein
MDVAEIRAWGSNQWKNQKVRQVVMLFSVSLASMPIGIVTSVVLSRFLGPNLYGDYNFLDNLFNLATIIFTLGFFYAANRALVINHDRKQASEYYGATLIVLIMLFFVMSLAFGIYVLVDPNLKQKHLDYIVLLSIPFGWVYLATTYFETLFQADNRIKLLAVGRLAPKIGFLISASVIYFFFTSNSHNKLLVAWSLYILAQVLASVFVFARIGMSFRNLKENVQKIWAYNKSYGLHVYTGSVFATGVSMLTGVLIGYFSKTNSGVGFYSLAVSLGGPMQLIPNTIATTNFKEFSKASSIPRKLTRVTLLFTISSLLVLWIIIPFFVNFFYSSKFKPVIYLTFIVSAGMACFGMADYYNRYLGSHGYGKSLRNNSFIVGSVILIFNLSLIPFYGAYGAAITRLLGGICYLICMLYYYRKAKVEMKLTLKAPAESN